MEVFHLLPLTLAQPAGAAALPPLLPGGGGDMDGINASCVLVHPASHAG